MTYHIINSFRLLQEAIRNDLAILESSNLRQANNDKYLEFKNKYDELNRKSLLVKVERESEGLTTDSKDMDSILWEWAHLSASFDMYMSYAGGYDDIVKYQIDKTKHTFQELLQKIDAENYQEIAQELQDTLNLYQSVSEVSFDSNEVQDLINKLKYRIYKYKLSDYTYDANVNYQSFLSFIIEDINKLIAESKVSGYLKDELQKYLFDVNLITNEFNRVAQLINIAYSGRKMSKADIDNYLNRTLYKENDLRKEYQPPTDELIIQQNIGVNKRLANIKKALSETDDKLNLTALIFQQQKYWLVPPFAEILSIMRKNGCDNFKYIAEALIDSFDKIIDLREGLVDISPQYIYEIDCAVIAHVSELSIDDLIKYITFTNNHYLINYIIKSNNKDYFNAQLRNYALKTCNEELIAYLENSDFIDKEIILHPTLSYNDKVEKIDKYLSNGNIPDSIKAEALILAYASNEDIDNQIQNYILSKLLLFNDKEIIIKLLTSIIEIYDGNQAESLSFQIIDMIPNPKLKKDIIAYICEQAKIPYSEEQYVFINDDKLRTSMQIGNDNRISFSKDDIDKFNIIEVYFASSRIYHTNNYFLEKHKSGNINWPAVINEFQTGGVNSYQYALKMLYNGNKTEFFRLLAANCFAIPISRLFDGSVSQDDHGIAFINKIVIENPESIVFFITELPVDYIIALPPSTIEIFCQAYEKKLKENDINFEDLVSKVFETCNDTNETLKLLVYIWHRGLMNSEIMLYKEKIRKYRDFYQLFTFAMSNIKEKYMRASMANKLSLERVDAIDWNSIFLSDADIALIDNDEKLSDDAKDLKKRKYYGDLLKLIDKAPDKFKIKIVKEIAKSSIREFIFYIKLHFPLYLDLLIDNVTDITIATELISSDTLDQSSGPPRN